MSPAAIDGNPSQISGWRLWGGAGWFGGGKRDWKTWDAIPFMKYPATFTTSARPQSRPGHENWGSPGGTTSRSHLRSTRLKQLTSASPTWPVSIRAPDPTPLPPDGPHSAVVPAAAPRTGLSAPLPPTWTENPVTYLLFCTQFEMTG